MNDVLIVSNGKILLPAELLVLCKSLSHLRLIQDAKTLRLGRRTTDGELVVLKGDIIELPETIAAKRLLLKGATFPIILEIVG